MKPSIRLLNRFPRLRGMLLNSLLRLHNACYAAVTRLAIHDEGGVHPKHRITQYHTWFLERIEPGSRCIDLGCGDGKMCALLAEKASEVLGVDISESAVRTARERVRLLPRASAVRFECGDITRLPLDGMEYDYIVLSNVLEHVADRVPFLIALQPLMRKGARLLLRVPMIEREWMAVFKRERGVEWRLDPTHYTEYTEGQLHDELARAGMRVPGGVRIRFGEAFAVVVSDADGDAGGREG